MVKNERQHFAQRNFSGIIYLAKIEWQKLSDKSSRGGLLHKLHDSVSLDQFPLGACMLTYVRFG